MDMKKLLEAVTKFSGEAVGQKPGDQVRGTEVAKSTKSGKDHPFKGRLVGASESILKDLSKGATPKTKEQELAEEWAAFNEEDLGVHPKRVGRKSDRHARGHEPHPRYKTIKEYGKKAAVNFTADDIKELEGIKDLNTLKTRAFALISKPSERPMKPEKVQWFKGALERITNPTAVIKLMYDLLLSGEGFGVIGSRHSTDPNTYRQRFDEASDQTYTVVIDRKGRERPVTGTIPELLDYFGYTLEVGKSYEHERGRYKINMNPKNIQSLVDNLNKAASNGAANSAPSTYYSVGESQVAEGVPYKATNPHPASKDPIVAKVLKQMRPGLTGLEMNNEAFLYFAYEIGKMRAREMWEDYGPAIKHFYQSGIGVNELDEAYGMGPKSYKGWTYDVWEDDDGDVRKKFHSAKKDGQEVDLDWSPYSTPSQQDWQLWIDLGMPTREQLGLRGPIRSEDLAAKAGQGTQSTEESRGHTIIANKLKDIERAKKFASGELKIPTPQERRAELEKSKEAEKKQVKEYGANTSTAAMGGTQQQQPAGAMPDVSKLNPQQKQQLALQLDPQAMKKAAAATSQIKSATGSSASGPNLLKALNAASQGKSVSGQDMTALKPMMDVVKKAATDPKLATQFKALASQAKQIK